MIIQDPTLAGLDPSSGDEVGFFFLIPLIPAAISAAATARKAKKTVKKAKKGIEKMSAPKAPTKSSGLFVIGNVNDPPPTPVERAAEFFAVRATEFSRVEDTRMVHEGLWAVDLSHADLDSTRETARLAAQTFWVHAQVRRCPDECLTVLFSDTPFEEEPSPR